MSTKSVKRRVAPLEHVVHPEGHVTQEKWNEASGTLGAGKQKGNKMRRVAPLEHLVHPEGHVTLLTKK
jgi:hypothetical protein